MVGLDYATIRLIGPHLLGCRRQG